MDILTKLPYTKPFLFVDEIEEIDEKGVKGNYTFDPSADFYRGHFVGYPLTPGVILTETMAQIGLVCLGIYLNSQNPGQSGADLVLLTSADVHFLLPVFPGERVTVVSTKNYFRFKKLSCNVVMFNTGGNTVCKGTLMGMVKKRE